MDRAALMKLAKGRAVASKKAPYFATGFLSLVPCETMEAETVLVTKSLIMAYNPEYIKERSDDEMAGLYYHELSHPLREHANRLLEGDPYLRNLAADITINDDGKRAGFVLPDGAVYSTTYGFPPGLTMEQYYELLRKRQEVQPPDRVDDFGVPPDHKNGPKAPTRESTNNNPSAKKGPCAGECGSAAGNSPNQALEDKLDAIQGLGRSELDTKRVQKQVAHDLKHHIAAHGRGDLPGELIEEILASLEPAKVPWTRVLSSILTSTCERIVSGHEEYTFRRISPRTYTRDDGLIRPGLVSYEPQIMFCLDTSGSMGSEQIGNALREAVGVMKALGIDEVTFLEADTKLTAAPRRVPVHALKHMSIHGRGGTDFRPAIAHAQSMKPKADALIYFTDGDGFAPAESPRGLEVIWCVVPSYYKKAPAPWGKTVFVE
jgi:predicted metal-dependent peptidase